MSARNLLVGCSVAAGVIVAAAVVVGIVAYRNLTALAPLPRPSDFVSADTVSLAIVRLAADDPWVKGTLRDVGRFSARPPRAADLFPLEVLWTQRRAGPGREAHTVMLSLSPNGRLLGLVMDVALWRSGRSEASRISRVEHAGEGITSFEGTLLPGHLFVRSNSIVWASDLDGARTAVDMMLAGEKGAGAAGERSDPTASRLLSLLPPEPHTVTGASMNVEGSLARGLALIPGAAAPPPQEVLRDVTDVSYSFDSTSDDGGEGRLILRFTPGTPPRIVEAATASVAGLLQGLAWEKVSLAITTELQPEVSRLVVSVAGLESVRAGLLEGAVSMQRALEGTAADERREEEPPSEGGPAGERPAIPEGR